MASQILRACAGALLSIVGLVAGAATGDWDQSFGVNGRVMLTAGEQINVITWEPQTDGKILVAGHTQVSAYLLARFNADGTLDPSFDGDGIVRPNFGTSVFGSQDLELLPSGQSLFAAEANDAPNHIKLLRLNADGSADASFGVSGEFQLTNSLPLRKPRLALAPNGSVIIAAQLGVSSSDQNIVVARVLANGTLDTSFGTAGLLQVGSSAPDKEVQAVTVQSDGSILIGGRLGSTSDPQAFVARVTNSGQLDASFGTNGITTLSFLQSYGFVERLAVSADGRIYAGGMARDLNGAMPSFVARLNANGVLDQSFGSGGRVILSGVMHSMLLEPTGKVVAAGWTNDLAPGLGWLARFNTDGSPDVTFGLRGRSRADFSLGTVRTRVIDAQIKPAADGSYRTLLSIAPDAGPASYAVARFVPSGTSAAVIGLRATSEPPFGTTTIRVSESSITRQIWFYRTGGTEGTVTAQYRVVGQSAQAGQDFVADTGTVTFNEGEVSKSINLQILDDNVREIPPETLYIELFAPTGGAVLSRSRLNVEILDNGDAGSFVSFVTASSVTTSAHAIESAGNLRLLVRRTGDLREPLAVNYSTVAGTATAGADFTAASGAVSWGANEGGIRSIDIAIVNDAAVESDEQFSVTLSSSSAEGLIGDDLVVRIGDDDDTTAAPVLSFRTSTATVAESASAVTIEVHRMGDPSQAVTATWSTTQSFGNWIARENLDYTQAVGTVSWGAGDVAPKTFTVPILEDTEAESAETFSVGIVATSPAGTQFGGEIKNVTILDNEAAPSQPTVSIDPGVTVNEAAGQVTFSLTLNGVPGNTVSVRYTVIEESAGVADVFISTNTVTWFVGESGSQQISIPIYDDGLDEIDETFAIVLVPDQGGAQVGTARAQFTIVDDDPTPAGQNPPVPPGLQLSESGVNVGESDRAARLTVTRVGGGEFMVRYVVTAGSAGEPADYYITASGVLTWLPGDPATKNFEVHINGDAQAEPDETFDIVFTPLLGAFQLPSATARVTIADDDEPDTSPARIEFVSATQTVQESATSVTLQVARSGNTTVATSVDYTTVAASATTADYTAASGTLTWDANDTSTKLITIALLPDSQDEADENFTVQLRNAASGTELGVASANVSIMDDDAPAPNPPSGGGGGGGGGGEESLITLLLWAAFATLRRGRKLPPTVQSY